MSLTDPRIVIEEMVAKVTGVKLPVAFGEPAVSAFDKVKVFDLQDLAKALEELFLVSSRVALIGLNSVSHSHEVRGRSLMISRSLAVTVILSDRHYSDRQKAMMGSEPGVNGTPGALLLAKLVVDAVAGELPSGAVVTAGDGRLAALEHAERKNQTGRIIFAQDFEVSVGSETMALSRKAVVGG